MPNPIDPTLNVDPRQQQIQGLQNIQQGLNQQGNVNNRMQDVQNLSVGQNNVEGQLDLAANNLTSAGLDPNDDRRNISDWASDNIPKATNSIKGFFRNLFGMHQPVGEETYGDLIDKGAAPLADPANRYAAIEDDGTEAHPIRGNETAKQLARRSPQVIHDFLEVPGQVRRLWHQDPENLEHLIRVAEERHVREHGGRLPPDLEDFYRMQRETIRGFNQEPRSDVPEGVPLLRDVHARGIPKVAHAGQMMDEVFDRPDIEAIRYFSDPNNYNAISSALAQRPADASRFRALMNRLMFSGEYLNLEPNQLRQFQRLKRRVDSGSAFGMGLRGGVRPGAGDPANPAPQGAPPPPPRPPPPYVPSPYAADDESELEDLGGPSAPPATPPPSAPPAEPPPFFPEVSEESGLGDEPPATPPPSAPPAGAAIPPAPQAEPPAAPRPYRREDVELPDDFRADINNTLAEARRRGPEFVQRQIEGFRDVLRTAEADGVPHIDIAGMEDMLHGLEAIQRELPPSSTPEMLRRFGNISGEEPRVSPHTQAIDERIAELKRQASLPINTPSVGTNRNNQRLAREAREELRRLNQEWQIIGDAAEPPAAPPAAPRPYRREDVELLPYQQDQIRDLVGYMSTQGPTEVAQHIELLENELRELHAEGDAPYSEIAQTEDSIRELRYLQRHLTGATLPPGVTLPPAPPAEPPAPPAEPPAPRPAHREVTIDDLRANQPSLLQRIFQGLRGIFDRVRPQRAESAPPALASEPQALGGSIPPSISEFRRLPRVPKVKPKEDPFLNANIYEDAAEGAKKLRSSEPLYEKPANRPYGELEDLRREQIPEMAFRRRRQRIEAAEKAEPPFKKNYQGDRIIPYYERRAVSRRIKNEMEELRQRRADVESATDRNDMDEQLVQYENSLRNRKEEHAENIARIMRNRFDGRRMLEGDVRQRPYVEGPMLPNHPPRSWFHKNIKKPIMRTIRRISNPNREPPMGDMQHLERAIRPEFNTPYHEDFLIRHSNAMRNYYMDPEDANRRKDYLDAEEELSRRGILNKDLLENQAAMPSLRRDIEKYRRMDDLSGKPLDDGLYTGSNYEVLEKQALRDAIQKEEILNAYRNPRDPRKRHTWNELTEPHYLPQFVGASTTDLRRRLASFDRGGRGNIDIEAMPEDIRKDFMRTNEELIRRQMSVMNNTELEDIRKKEPANMANWYSKMASDLAKEELHRRTAAGENRHSYLARVDQLSNIVRRREKLDRKWDEFMGLPPIDIPPRFSEAPQRRLPPPPPRYSPPADMRAGHMAARVANNPKFRKVRERFNNVDLVPATKEIQIPQSDGSVEHYEAHYRSPNPAVYHNYIPGRRQMLGLDLRWVPEQILRNTSRNTNSGWERSPSGFDFHRYMTTPPPPTSPPLRPPVQAQPQIMPIIEEMVIPKRTKKKGKAHVNFFKDEEKK